MGTLEGKLALVTGGSTGIGRAIAESSRPKERRSRSPPFEPKGSGGDLCAACERRQSRSRRPRRRLRRRPSRPDCRGGRVRPRRAPRSRRERRDHARTPRPSQRAHLVRHPEGTDHVRDRSRRNRPLPAQTPAKARDSRKTDPAPRAQGDSATKWISPVPNAPSAGAKILLLKSPRREIRYPPIDRLR